MVAPQLMTSARTGTGRDDWCTPQPVIDRVLDVGPIALDGSAGGEVIALVPARTDTRAWQRFATRADAVCFWRGRIRFAGADAGAPFPTAFLYWGPRVGRFIAAFESAGAVYGRTVSR